MAWEGTGGELWEGGTSFFLFSFSKGKLLLSFHWPSETDRCWQPIIIHKDDTFHLRGNHTLCPYSRAIDLSHLSLSLSLSVPISLFMHTLQVCVWLPVCVCVCWPCLEPLRSLLGPVLGVYLVSLVAALWRVQSNSSVLSWVNMHTASSSKPHWNSPAHDINTHTYKVRHISCYVFSKLTATKL